MQSGSKGKKGADSQQTVPVPDSLNDMVVNQPSD